MTPTSSRSGPSHQHHRCEGDGCASAVDTWPLHHVYRSGVPSRICTSCILLSYRSYYCCSCFFLIPLAVEWSLYEDGDPYVASRAPIATCDVCHEAVAHLHCLPPADGAFVCSVCSAAAEGKPFTYAPPCGEPHDKRAARVLVVGARLALLQLQQRGNMARAEAERLARNAFAMRRRAYRALAAAQGMDAERLARNAFAMRRRAYRALAAAQGMDAELPFQNVNADQDPPSSSKNRQEVGEGSGTSANAPLARQPRSRIASAIRQEEGEGSGTSVNALLVRRKRYAMPPLSTLTIGTERLTALAVAATEAARDSPPSPRQREMPLSSIPEAATAEFGDSAF